jgi:hypothetical protein
MASRFTAQMAFRIDLDHAPGNATTIEGKFDDWVRSIHS